MSPEQQAEGWKYYAALDDELTDSRELILSEALGDPREGFVVTVRDGQTVTTDGPFAETKEHLAGFFLVDCHTPQRAAEIAARMPEARYGLIEVRPVIDLGPLTPSEPG
jgi:hypothetical protein